MGVRFSGVLNTKSVRRPVCSWLLNASVLPFGGMGCAGAALWGRKAVHWPTRHRVVSLPSSQSFCLDHRVESACSRRNLATRHLLPPKIIFEYALFRSGGCHLAMKREDKHVSPTILAEAAACGVARWPRLHLCLPWHAAGQRWFRAVMQKTLASKRLQTKFVKQRDAVLTCVE